MLAYAEEWDDGTSFGLKLDEAPADKKNFIVVA